MVVGGRSLMFILTVALVAAAVTGGPAFAQRQRVLVIMSYEEEYAWEQDIRRGIQAGLGAQCELRFF